MPPSFGSTRSRRLRLLSALLLVAALAGGLLAARFLGRFLYVEDPLQRADAIFVLAGTYLERPLEASMLYREGYAPLIVLSSQISDGGELALARRGACVPSIEELAKQTLVDTGVPDQAIIVLDPDRNSTADEARSLDDLIRQQNWRSVIVVTSRLHTRRARLAIRRTIAGTGVRMVMRASRYDPSDPEHWWRSRTDVRWTLSETQKFVAYALGLAG